MGTGNYAKVPYDMEKFYVNLYSVEELCYLLVDKAELLDDDIMQRELVGWLDEECGLDRLAHTLYSLLNQKGTTAAFVGTILEYVNLYPPEVIARTEQIIRSNEGLNTFERSRAKADFMLENRKYHNALKQYTALLGRLPETEERMRAEVLHNMGVACAKLFLFRRAADYFREAYDVDQNEASLELYLAAQRMCHDDQEYVAYIAGHPEYHDMSLRVERKINQAQGQFEGTDENRMLFTLQVFREEGNSEVSGNARYYQEIERLTAGLKEAYREYMS